MSLHAYSFVPVNAEHQVPEISVVQRKTSGKERSNYRPSVEVPQEFIAIFDAMNHRFWNSTLEDCIFTWTRKKRTLGYYSPERLSRTTGETCAEIALNPEWLAVLDPIAAISVLAHEVVHHQRHTQGPVDAKGRRGSLGYHDSAWAEEMKRIGLYPSNTGRPGGNETGKQMMHYIIEGGPFDLLSQELLEQGLWFHWHENIDVKAEFDFDKSDPFAVGRKLKPKTRKTKLSRSKFTCPSCNLNAWAKPDARLLCAQCNLLMICESTTGGSEKLPAKT